MVSATDLVQKRSIKNKWVLFLLSMRMSEKALKFDNIRVITKKFHKSKQPFNLDLVNIDQIVISNKFKIVMVVSSILLVT